jgi:hypothetical protein
MRTMIKSIVWKLNVANASYFAVCLSAAVKVVVRKDAQQLYFKSKTYKVPL